MWWSDRRRVLLLPLVAGLAACGLTPVYGPGGSGSALYGRIAVDAPDDRSSYLLVRTLEEKLGRADVPDYDLAVKLKTDTEGQAVTASGDITRYSIVGEAAFALTGRGDDTAEPVAEGVVRNFTGYSATGSTVETLAAQRDAEKRLMIILANQIATQIYATAQVAK